MRLAAQGGGLSPIDTPVTGRIPPDHSTPERRQMWAAIARASRRNPVSADIREFEGVTLMNNADRELVEKFVAPSSNERGFLVRYEATVKDREWTITRLRSA